MLENLKKKWPSSIVARQHVAKFSGGVLNAKTMANRDAAGTGPRERLRIGRKIAYPVEALVTWMRENATTITDDINMK